MQRVIYSVYVDVPAKEHYGKSKQIYDTVEKADITVSAVSYTHLTLPTKRIV